MACLGVLMAGTVHGQARNATGRKAQVRVDPVVEHATKLAQIDGWLRSLAGQYRLSVLGTSLEGIADCAVIGPGPGVHCIFSVGAPGQRDRWENAVMLFGIDTEGPTVHRFQLNRDSTAEMGMSRLRGEAVRFSLECPVIQHYSPTISPYGVTTYDVLFCRRETRIHVAPDGRFVRIRLSTAERVLVRQPPPSRSQISEFPSLTEWSLERVQQ